MMFEFRLIGSANGRQTAAYQQLLRRATRSRGAAGTRDSSQASRTRRPQQQGQVKPSISLFKVQDHHETWFLYRKDQIRLKTLQVQENIKLKMIIKTQGPSSPLQSTLFVSALIPYFNVIALPRKAWSSRLFCSRGLQRRHTLTSDPRTRCQLSSFDETAQYQQFTHAALISGC